MVLTAAFCHVNTGIFRETGPFKVSNFILSSFIEGHLIRLMKKEVFTVFLYIHDF